MQISQLMIIGLFVLGGCAGNREVSKPDAFLAEYNIARPQPTALTYCSHHGCLKRTQLTLSDGEWQSIKTTMLPLAQTAAQERQNISKSVAVFEKIAGVMVGTSRDKGRTGLNNNDQLDCIDESMNTTSLLLLLFDEQLLKWHSIDGTVGRGGAFDWPHFATSLRERGGNGIYVVDSWFRDNGIPADVLPLKTWKAGWNPPVLN